MSLDQWAAMAEIVAAIAAIVAIAIASWQFAKQQKFKLREYQALVQDEARSVDCWPLRKAGAVWCKAIVISNKSGGCVREFSLEGWDCDQNAQGESDKSKDDNKPLNLPRKMGENVAWASIPEGLSIIEIANDSKPVYPKPISADDLYAQWEPQFVSRNGLKIDRIHFVDRRGNVWDALYHQGGQHEVKLRHTDDERLKEIEEPLP